MVKKINKLIIGSVLCIFYSTLSAGTNDINPHAPPVILPPLPPVTPPLPPVVIPPIITLPPIGSLLCVKLETAQVAVIKEGLIPPKTSFRYSGWREKCADGTVKARLNIKGRHGSLNKITDVTIKQGTTEIFGNVSLLLNFPGKTNKTYDVNDLVDISRIDLTKAFTVRVRCNAFCRVNNRASQTFTFDALPDTSTPVPLHNLSGAWYDPAYDGLGFNFVQTSSGLLIYYYGYKGEGNGKAQWLLSEQGPVDIKTTKKVTLKMYSGFEGNGGNFSTKPSTHNAGTQLWGKLEITMKTCTRGVLKLIGTDGTVTHNVIKLANISGSRPCTRPGPEKEIPNSISGAWYDPNYDGLGFNVVQTSSGLFVYYYGYKGEGDGKAQWLLSEKGPTSVNTGEKVTLKMYSGFEGNGGNFSTKPTTANSGTQLWGNVEITMSSCTQGIMKLVGTDGSVTHNVIKLANISGLKCTE